MKVQGGVLSATMKGLSATAVAANNLRGIDVAVPSGGREIAVRFETPEPDSKYSLSVQPNWLTQVAVIEKNARGFKVIFSVPGKAKARIDWQLLR